MSCRLYLPLSPLWLGMPACLTSRSLSPSRSRSPVPSLAPSWRDFAAGLNTDLKLCPVRALRLYLLRARSLSPGRHRLSVSPRRPSRAMSKNAVSFFLGEVISAAEAARPRVGSLRAHDVRSVSTSAAFHRNWSVTFVLNQPLGPPVRCSHPFLLAASNTNLMAYFLLVPSWLLVLG